MLRTLKLQWTSSLLGWHQQPLSNTGTVPQRRESSRVDNSTVCCCQCVDCRHVRAIQLKVEYRYVLRQSIDLSGSRKRNGIALLNKPPQNYLGDGFVMAGRDLLKRGVREDAANRHATVACHGKSRLQRAVDEQGLVQIRMVFELIRHERCRRESDSFRHQCAIEIADADVANLAGAYNSVESRDLFGQGHV